MERFTHSGGSPPGSLECAAHPLGERRRGLTGVNPAQLNFRYSWQARKRTLSQPWAGGTIGGTEAAQLHIPRLGPCLPLPKKYYTVVMESEYALSLQGHGFTQFKVRKGPHLSCHH